MPAARIVIDPSALLAVLLHEAERDLLIAATQKAILLSPASTPWEVGNALIAGLRRRRLDLDGVLAAWASYAAVPLRLVEVDVPSALRGAAEAGLYAYDGYVLELARSQRAPILTLDRGLQRAAARMDIQVMET